MNLNLNKFWKKRSVTITEYDPSYKVVYLGNVLTAWAKGEGCADKPLATLWKNYCQNTKPDVFMKVTICNSGLKAVTKLHGLTEYWSNRITYCVALPQYPKVFCWVYRHEGKKLRQELRCHAVLCKKEETARKMASQLQLKLTLALQEFKREKICRQNARLSLANSVYDNPSLPRRKILLCTGSSNYRPPLERSKSAPKLMAIEEAISEVAEEKEIDVDTTVTEEDDDDYVEISGHQKHHLSTEHSPDKLQIVCRPGRRYSDVVRPSPRDLDDYSDELCDHRHSYHRLRLLSSELDEIDDDDDTLTNCNELDDIEVCLFDPMEPGDNGMDMMTTDDTDDDMLMMAAYNSNPNGHTPPPIRHVQVVNDDIMSSDSSSTSSSSSPSSLRLTNVKTDDDTVSDESGYSEDNGVAMVRDRICACTT